MKNLGLIKVTRDTIFARCGCGADREIPMASALATKGQVLLPLCESCKKKLMILVCAESIEGMGAAQVKMFSATHTLHKRLVDAGRTHKLEVPVTYPGVSEEDVVFSADEPAQEAENG